MITITLYTHVQYNTAAIIIITLNHDQYNADVVITTPPSGDCIVIKASMKYKALWCVSIVISSEIKFKMHILYKYLGNKIYIFVHVVIV